MELLDVIKKRRSIRKFKNIDIKKEKIEDIIKCGLLAPSAKNRQPWTLAVVKNKNKDNIVKIAMDNFKQAKINRNKNLYKSTIEETIRFINEASVLILIFKKKDEYWTISDTLSIGACLENMCLRATDLGIGSVCIRDLYYVSKLIEKYIGKPNLELSCALALGIPNETPDKIERKKIEDIVKWYI